MESSKLKIFYWKLEQQLYLLGAKFSGLPGNSRYMAMQEVDAIVSLTSYPPRFVTLYENLKSILKQNVRPKKLVLWIAESDYKLLPPKVVALQKKFGVFEIKTCKDLRSYKKIIPSLAEYPTDNIVICDDDIIYPKTWLSSLVNAWNGTDKHVVAHRVHEIQFKKIGHPAPYASWIPHSKANKHSKYLFPTGMGGVFYPAGCFDTEVGNKQQFQSLCPAADDIWLYWMAKLNGCDITYSGTRLNFVALPGTDVGGLASENVSQDGNDRQIGNMLQHYGWYE